MRTHGIYFHDTFAFQILYTSQKIKEVHKLRAKPSFLHLINEWIRAFSKASICQLNFSQVVFTGTPLFSRSLILTDSQLLDFLKALGYLCEHGFDGFYRTIYLVLSSCGFQSSWIFHSLKYPREERSPCTLSFATKY